jgi:hypothetical protein
MTYTELLKFVNQELEWLRYYTHRDYKIKLTKDSSIYDTLISIGYTKRVISLDLRCPSAILTSVDSINNLTDLNALEIISKPRNHNENCYTALEFFWIKYPEKRQDVIDNLNSGQNTAKKVS